MSLLLRIRDFIKKGEHSHCARLILDDQHSVSIHRHDFHEICWIESGEGLHLIRGRRRPLCSGALLFIRPDDEHALRPRGGKPLCLVNIAFRSSAWQSLAKRYLNVRGDVFRLPLSQREIHCPEMRLLQLAEWSVPLASGDRSRLALDRFLLNVVEIVASSASLPFKSRPPEWLRRACEGIRDPVHFREGSRAFSRLAGRSPEHVARCARQFLGKTPTEIVNDARLAKAELLLVESEDPITTVAEECGFINMPHFYDLFRHRCGLTPAAFRRRSRQILGHRP